jgi:hypothetical protein
VWSCRWSPTFLLWRWRQFVLQKGWWQPRRPQSTNYKCLRINVQLDLTKDKISGQFWVAWSNWRPAGHIRPETTCNQAHEIICEFVSSYYKLVHFLHSEGLFYLLLSPVSGKLILETVLSEKINWTVKPGRALLSTARSAEDEDWPVDAVGCFLVTRGSCGSNDKCLTPHYPLLGLHGFAPFRVSDSTHRVLQMWSCLFHVLRIFNLTLLTDFLRRLSTFSLYDLIYPLKPKLVYIIFKDSVPTAKKTQHFTVTKMVFREIIAVYSENHTKFINTLRGKMQGLLKQVTHWDLKG